LPTPISTERLFLAILPEPGVAARIRLLADGLFASRGVDGSGLAEDRLHVTLQFLGDFRGLPTGLVAAVELALENIGIAGFTAVFDRASSFDGEPSRRPWVMSGVGPGMDTMRALHDHIVQRLASVGIVLRGRPEFRPHVTLGYVDKALPERAVAAFVLRVRDVALVRSFIGQGRHEVFRCWPLQAPS
jgi:2'-5' RNA ligase